MHVQRCMTHCEDCQGPGKGCLLCHRREMPYLLKRAAPCSYDIYFVPPSAASDRDRGTRRPFLQRAGARKSLWGPGRRDFFLSEVGPVSPSPQALHLTKTRQEGEAACATCCPLAVQESWQSGPGHGQCGHGCGHSAPCLDHPSRIRGNPCGRRKHSFSAKHLVRSHF